LIETLRPNLIESLNFIERNAKPSSHSPKISKDFEPEKTDGLKPSKKKVWIEAYGCSASMADSEMMSGLLKADGYEIATDENESSLNIIVTCSVKDVTQHRMLHRIDKLSRSVKPLIVAGCLPKTERQRIESLNPFASLLGPHSIDRTIDVVHSARLGKKSVFVEDSSSDKINLPKIRINPIVSIIEIASGCMSECSFCQTKLAKGRLRSYRIGDILRQMRGDIANGCKEIWLSSTDNGCYGKDIGSDLVHLLRSCCLLEGDYKIRVGMMNPMYLPCMLKDMIEVFADNDKIFKFLHIPVQSGSNRILRKMKRGHTVETYHNIVKAFRKAFPEITIATDVIIGFPSETNEDFLKTIDLLKETEPDIVNSSKYSSRSGTEACKLKQVDSYVVKQRSELLHKLIKEIGAKRNSIWKGWRGNVIIDEISENNIQGRNYAYKPVLLSSECEISDKAAKFMPQIGEEIPVEIYGYSSYSLTSHIINSTLISK
jgi:threonylcarbamoyladenosine tRNA methylthiotransferase CDKAL1